MNKELLSVGNEPRFQDDFQTKSTWLAIAEIRDLGRLLHLCTPGYDVHLKQFMAHRKFCSTFQYPIAASASADIEVGQTSFLIYRDKLRTSIES